MQGGAGVALKTVDPETDCKTLKMVLGYDDLGAKVDDLGAKVDALQADVTVVERTLVMLVDYIRRGHRVALNANESITDREAEFTLPIPVTMLPEGFPAHNTLARLERLNNAHLKQILEAHNVPFQDNALKAILIIHFLYECGARNLVRQVAQNNQHLLEN